MESGTDDNKNRYHREIVMSTHATSLPVTGQFLAAADAAKPPLGARLLSAIMAAQQRKADRRTLRFSSIRHDSYRQEFGLELERRLLGQ
jgi:uncharacterized heparinase superfamily protein